ncbi:MAG: hypothetical protein ACLRW2_08540 [Parasutterella excrementihominis]
MKNEPRYAEACDEIALTDCLEETSALAVEKLVGEIGDIGKHIA